MPDEGGTVHKLRYWRLCGNKVCGFEKGLVLSYSLFLALVIAVMELLMYFQQSLSVSEMINLPFPMMELVPILAFIGYFYWKKSKRKPIYDRWVHQHGTDAKSWANALKPD